jgi:hypothetical protein
MRPVGVVVIDVFAEDVVQVPSAGDEDPVGALVRAENLVHVMRPGDIR